MNEISAHEAIARAKPFIDSGASEVKWLPSELLTIGWCMIASGKSNISGADAYVSDMLDEARNRWAAGFYPNPFEEPVRVRPVDFRIVERDNGGEA